MKAILEFDLDRPSQRYQHKLALQAEDWKSVVAEVDEYIRQEVKYHDHSDETDASLLGVRDRLRELCVFYGLEIDEDTPDDSEG